MEIENTELRLINANSLLEVFDFVCMDESWWFMDKVEEAPTIDPVHAAGGCDCHECLYSKENLQGLFCSSVSGAWRHIEPSGFCSDGKRKEGNGKSNE